MKKLLLIAAALLMAYGTTGKPEPTADIWEPTGTVPKYRLRQDSTGTIRVYEYGDPFQYRYRIEPDGKIYRYGDPFEPMGEVKDGLFTHTEKRGER